MAARRPYIVVNLRSLGASAKAVRLASLHSQPTYSRMFCIGIFIDLQPVGQKFSGELFDPPGLGLWGTWGHDRPI